MRQVGWLDDIIVHRRAPEDPHLQRVQIEALLTCNLSCSYCYSTSGPGRKERLSHEEIIDVINQADAMAVQQIDFTDGEYLMIPRWRDQVAYARELGMIVTVHTNGTLLTPASVQTLHDLSMVYVQVSADSCRLDGPENAGLTEFYRCMGGRVVPSVWIHKEVLP